MDWLKKVITEQLSILIALSLPYRPSDEMFPITVKVWIETFGTALGRADQSLDEPRIRAAFKEARTKLTKWPAPFQILELLPRRPEVKKIHYDPPADPDLSKLAFQVASMVAQGEITTEDGLKLLQKGKTDEEAEKKD